MVERQKSKKWPFFQFWGKTTPVIARWAKKYMFESRKRPGFCPWRLPGSKKSEKSWKIIKVEKVEISCHLSSRSRKSKNRYFQNVKSRNRGMKIYLPWSQQLKRRQRFRRVEKLSYLPEN